MKAPEQGIAVVEAYFHQSGWTFERVDQSAVVAPIDTERGRLMCIASVNDQRFLCESRYSFVVPQMKRMLVAEFATRANCQIEEGSISMNLDDGDVGVRTSFALGGCDWNPAVVGSVMRHHLEIADRWLPGVAVVCFADISPQRALRLCTTTTPVSEVIDQASKLLDHE